MSENEARLADMLPDMLPLACRLGVSQLMASFDGTALPGHAGSRLSSI
jgi:hypothetical protein